MIRSVPLDADLDRQLGRLAQNLDVSKAKLLRSMAEGLMAGTIKVTQLGLLVVLDAGVGIF